MITIFLGGVAAWGAFNWSLELTNTEKFCVSCHEMKTHILSEYKKSSHYANRTGVRASCPDCHVPTCNDCAKCNVVCEFGLDPLRDGFGQECINCAACIAVCPTDALTFTLAFRDQAAQGPGHLGRQYKREHEAKFEQAAE